MINTGGKTMINKKGLELAISTLILIILGIVILIGLLYAVTGGFKKFKSTTDPLLQSVEGSAVKKACEIACQGEDKITYCCKEQSISGTKLKCNDNRLEIECPLRCEGFSCG